MTEQELFKPFLPLFEVVFTWSIKQNKIIINKSLYSVGWLLTSWYFSVLLFSKFPSFHDYFAPLQSFLLSSGYPGKCLHSAWLKLMGALPSASVNMELFSVPNSINILVSHNTCFPSPPMPHFSSLHIFSLLWHLLIHALYPIHHIHLSSPVMLS